jgi:YHS domain-containing protein
MSNEICITEYETDIEGGASYFCSELIEDFDGDKKEAYAYAERNQMWEEVPAINYW